jgi:hypothetical protein
MLPISRRDRGKIRSCSTLPYYDVTKKTMRRIHQRIVQSTVCIARIMIKAPICRTFFCGQYCGRLSTAVGSLSPVTTSIDRVSPVWERDVLQVFCYRIAC